MERLLLSLTTDFNYVIIDSPPLLLVTDAAVVSKLADGAILVAASGRTKRAELTAAVRALDHIGSKLLGVVVTLLPTKGPYAYGYGTYAYGDTSAFADSKVVTKRQRRRVGRKG